MLKNILFKFFSILLLVGMVYLFVKVRQYYTISACIFDMDGTLAVDSEEHWRVFEEELLKNNVPDWKESDRMNLLGRTIPDVYRYLKSRYPKFSLLEVEFIGLYDKEIQVIYEQKSHVIAGFEFFYSYLQKRGVNKFAIVSSSPKTWIEIFVKRNGLQDFFPIIVSADDVGGIGKPDPRIYKLGLEKLGVYGSQCIVIEDSKNGVLSAKGAGVGVVFGLRNGFNDNQDLSRSTFVVKNLEEVIRKLK